MKGNVQDPLHVLTVCGVGMGSSLILKMNVERALDQLDMRATVENSDLSSARSVGADVLIGQDMHTDELSGAAPVVLGISNFMDIDGLREQLSQAFREAGWLSGDPHA